MRIILRSESFSDTNPISPEAKSVTIMLEDEANIHIEGLDVEDDEAMLYAATITIDTHVSSLSDDGDFIPADSQPVYIIKNALFIHIISYLVDLMESTLDEEDAEARLTGEHTGIMDIFLDKLEAMSDKKSRSKTASNKKKSKPHKRKEGEYLINRHNVEDFPEDTFGNKLFVINGLEDIEPIVGLNHLWPIDMAAEWK